MSIATAEARGAEAYSHLKDAEMVEYGAPVFNRVMHFLIAESRALDERRLEDWLDFLDEGIFYHMPVRRTRLSGSTSEFDQKTNWFHETKSSIAFKIKRILVSGSAWAEDPPTRVRRFISNLVLHETSDADVYRAESYLLLTRSRGDEHTPDVISARRNDILRAVPGGFQVMRRSIYMDHTVLGVPSLPFFL